MHMHRLTWIKKRIQNNDYINESPHNAEATTTMKKIHAAISMGENNYLKTNTINDSEKSTVNRNKPSVALEQQLRRKN